MDGILLDRIVMDFKFIYIECVGRLLRQGHVTCQVSGHL